jgi:hypothetical protein
VPRRFAAGAQGVKDMPLLGEDIIMAHVPQPARDRSGIGHGLGGLARAKPEQKGHAGGGAHPAHGGGGVPVAIVARIHRRAHSDHRLIAAHRGIEPRLHAGLGQAHRRRPDHRAGVEQRGAVDIIHLKHIAKIARALPALGADRPGHGKGCRAAPPGDAGEPIEKVPARTLALAFAARAR